MEQLHKDASCGTLGELGKWHLLHQLQFRRKAYELFCFFLKKSLNVYERVLDDVKANAVPHMTEPG